MSALIEPPPPHRDASALIGGDGDRLLSFGRHTVTAARFLADVAAVAATLPAASQAVNLCEDRYAFLVAFGAVVARGQANLLPSSRVPGAVADVLARYGDAYCVAECALAPAPPRLHVLPALPCAATATLPAAPAIASGAVVAIGFTSGSTGMPTANPKTWGSFVASSARNGERLRALIGRPRLPPLVATVPPQHMYGMELSVLLPLLEIAPVHDGRPFFPAEIVAALQQAPEPPLLVTTPLHLRALIDSALPLPALAAIVSATAPLGSALARAAEQRCGAPVLEMFGSTETCVIGYRRTAHEADWECYPDLSLTPQPDGTRVDAPYLPAPVLLPDLIEPLAPDRFRVAGRNADLLEIAGKRASLGDLTRRLLAVPGVRDGIVFQAEGEGGSGVRRICALAVAPELAAADILAALRRELDPVFLPRPLLLVESLPRNEVGKLPRTALLSLLEQHRRG